ncbi:MAG TPA: SufS family cysteine desulfurase [Candidatus Babeliales bacterium]|nr:SufS family cysteine desulfurase [Candidatus Babeliales bacterium]
MNSLRSLFPILDTKINGKPLVYFDNAATTQKPISVIKAESSFYMACNATVHRGVYSLAERATAAYEDARKKVGQFIGAQDPNTIVFTRGTTESINCVALSWAMHHIQEGNEIVISELEHHSNLLPWQRIAKIKKASLRYIPVLADSTLDLAQLPTLLSDKTKLVAITHVSNALGTHVDIKQVIDAAHGVGAKVLIDAAQSVAHQKINVAELNPDFLAFSGHKLFGPNGIGILYVNKQLHDQLEPFQVGGGMVYEVDFQKATWRTMPYLLEAGTPAIAQAIGLGAALDFINGHIDFTAVQKHEAQLCAQLIDGLDQIKGITALGPVEQLKKMGHLVSFTVDGIHPHDVAAYLDTYGICVRAGHHCAQPLAAKMNVEASVRVSFSAYNTAKEVDLLLDALEQLMKSTIIKTA